MLDLESAPEFKLFAAALICALALAGGGAPLLIRLLGVHRTGDGSRSSSASERVAAITSVLNMFAGGIFLSGAVLHLLPDAQENAALATWMCAAEDGCFKWANFFFGCGFLLVLLLEVLAHAAQDSLADKRYLSRQPHQQQQQAECELAPLASHEQQRHFRHHESCSSIETDASTSPLARPPSSEGHILVATGLRHHHDHDIESGAHGHKYTSGPSPTHYGAIACRQQEHERSSKDTSTPSSHDDISHAHSHAHGLLVDADGNPLLALVVFAALSFHSVMEGMGIGASPHAAWDVLAAVLAHKSLAAFALAQELLQHHVAARRVVASVGVFSLMTPAGILLGSLLAGGGDGGQQESVASGVCAALAGGTFLFVATAEVLPQELRSRRHLPLKCGALLAGYGAMGALSLWA